VLKEYYASSVAHKAQGDEQFTSDDIVDLVYMTIQAYVRNDQTSSSVVPVVWRSLEKGLAHDPIATSDYHVFHKKVLKLIKLEKIVSGQGKDALTIRDPAIDDVEDELNALMNDIEEDAQSLSKKFKPFNVQKQRSDAGPSTMDIKTTLIDNPAKRKSQPRYLDDQHSQRTTLKVK
jgi:hypothetical protein